MRLLVWLRHSTENNSSCRPRTGRFSIRSGMGFLPAQDDELYVQNSRSKVT